jgi:hypothetical protein
MSSNIPTSSINNTNITNNTNTNNNNNIHNITTIDISEPEWNERTIRLLINQRKYRNQEYYRIIGRSRVNYWNSVARRINRDVGSNFTGVQCKRKFNNLVSKYYVSKLFDDIKYVYYIYLLIYILNIIGYMLFYARR